jgi:gamma-glutamylcyclotransferase (GGCT)/AIG2-like uncharacterized protein YtfP
MEEPADHIVLYGSLRRGEASYRRLGLERRLAFVRPVRFAGVLYDLGDYPGAALGGDGWIVGELYRIVDRSVLADLDAFECFDPEDPSPYDASAGTGSLYLRKLVAAGRVRAYVYEPNPDGRDHPVIPSGDWLAHRRGR